MSSSFQKSALQLSQEGPWALHRGAECWVSLPASSSILRSERQGDTDALLARARAAQAPVHALAPGWVALPTGIDLQVHLRFPGQPQKESLEGGLESALAGGFDALVTMPNTNPFLDRVELLRKAQDDCRTTVARYPVRVGFAASATIGMQGREPTDIPALARAGAVAITDDGWGVKSGDAQARIFSACAEAGILFQQHAEQPGHRGVATASEFQRRHGLPEYPRSAESEMVRRDLALLRAQPKARYHVLHVSTRESLEEIRRAKGEGLRVTAEASPHHLFFSNADIPGPDDPRSSFFKFNPPLFDPEDRQALRQALRDGTIDCVSTDHAPHELELKGKGWALAPFGTRGLETALPALLSLHHAGELSLPRLVELFSTAPRTVLGVPELARPSGVLFVDPASEQLIGEADLPGISRNSCFLGTRLHGRIELRAEPGRLYRRS